MIPYSIGLHPLNQIMGVLPYFQWMKSFYFELLGVGRREKLEIRLVSGGEVTRHEAALEPGVDLATRAVDVAGADGADVRGRKSWYGLLAHGVPQEGDARAQVIKGRGEPVGRQRRT